MICVIDASAAVGVVLGRPESRSIESALASADAVIAPDLFVAEVANALWKHRRFDKFDALACEDALEKAIAIPDDFLSSAPLWREAFAVASDLGTTVYDALYLVAARRHHATLLTTDKALAKAAARLSVRTNTKET